MKNQKIYEAMGWDSRTAERDLRDPDSLVSRVVAFVDSLNPSYETRLRDEYIGRIIQGLCVNVGRNGYTFDQKEELSELAVTLADAVMQARKQGGE